MKEKPLFKICAVIAAIAIVAITAVLPEPAGLSFEGKMMIGLLVASIVLWVTEAIPILITTWLFAVSVPILGILTPGETWSSGVSVAMILCLSCFAFAMFFEKSTIALRIINVIFKYAKNDSKKLLFGMMLATALISTIVDDLILTIVMLAFAYKILDANETPWGAKSGLAKSLALGIPIASYIGGWITPVGSIVNILCIGFAEQALGVGVSFISWMVMGLVCAVIMFPLTWFVLVKIFKPEPVSDEAIAKLQEEVDGLGKFTKDEIWGLLIIAVTFVAWVAGSWFPAIDAMVVGLVALGFMFLPPFKTVSFDAYIKESAWEVVFLNWGVGCFVAGMMATGSMTWLVNTVFGPLAALPLFAALIVIAILACLFHNILPVGAAVAGLITIPICTFVAAMGGNISAAIFMCAVFSSAALLLPLDLVVYVSYSNERKYYTMGDQLKFGWAPSLALVFVVTVAVPAACAMMGLQ